MLTFLQFLLEANPINKMDKGFGVGQDEDYPAISNKKKGETPQDTQNGYLEFVIYDINKERPKCQPYTVTNDKRHGKVSHAIKHLIDVPSLFKGLINDIQNIIQKYITTKLNVTIDIEEVKNTIKSIKTDVENNKLTGKARKTYDALNKILEKTTATDIESIVKTLQTKPDFKNLSDNSKKEIEKLVKKFSGNRTITTLVIEWHRGKEHTDIFNFVNDSALDLHKSEINNKTILNTLDYIQDKTYSNVKLNDIEIEIYENIIKKHILSEYNKNIKSNVSDCDIINLNTIKEMDFDKIDGIKATLDDKKYTHIKLVDTKSEDTNRFQAICTAKTDSVIITSFNCAEVSLTKHNTDFVCPIYPIMSDTNKRRLAKIIGFSYLFSSIGDYNPDKSNILRSIYKKKLDELANKFNDENLIEKEHKDFFQKNKEYDSSLEKYKDLDAYKAEYEREYAYLTQRVINYNARKEIRFGKY